MCLSVTSVWQREDELDMVLRDVLALALVLLVTACSGFPWASKLKKENAGEARSSLSVLRRGFVFMCVSRCCLKCEDYNHHHPIRGCCCFWVFFLGGGVFVCLFVCVFVDYSLGVIVHVLAVIFEYGYCGAAVSTVGGVFGSLSCVMQRRGFDPPLNLR